MSAPFSDKCMQVVYHEGTPTGSFITVEGHKVYTATPTGDYSKKAALIICPDLFGVDLVNIRLIADSYAIAGLMTYIPDYLNGDGVPQDQRSNPERYPNWDQTAWRNRHTPKETRPALDACVEYCKKEGFTKIFSVGYCFGARYVVDLALEGIIHTGVVAHPSHLKVPEDLSKLSALEPKVPMLFLTCERDGMFPPASQSQADEILGGLGEKYYKRVYYANNDHGFAVRGDLSKPDVKNAKEDAFKQAVDWFKQSL